MYELPTKLNIGGVDYDIRGQGDFRVIISTFSVLEDTKLDKNERIMVALGMFYDGVDTVDDINAIPDLEEAVRQMYWFFDAGRPEGGIAGKKLIDWDNDSAMICSAINQTAGKEIRELSYLHWWTFMGYYMAIGESTMTTVISIRDKIANGKKLEKWERQYRRENPQYFNWNSKTAEEQEADNWVLSQWYEGDK